MIVSGIWAQVGSYRCITAPDNTLSDTFWFRSPQGWGGNWRQYIGGIIEWDVFLYPNYPFEYYSQIELIIDEVGTGNYLSADLDIIPDRDQWTHFKINFTRENIAVHGDLTFEFCKKNWTSVQAEI
jgi:hypothetical protein